MNYIHQLQAAKRASERELATLKQELEGLRAYLHSRKFNCGDPLDSYVNVADVLNHLRDAQGQALLARECDVEQLNAA